MHRSSFLILFLLLIVLPDALCKPVAEGDDAAGAEKLCALSADYLSKGDILKANAFATRAIQLNAGIQDMRHWECMLQYLKCRKVLYQRHLLAATAAKADIDLIRATIIEANLSRQTCPTEEQPFYAEQLTLLNRMGIYLLTQEYRKTDSFFLNRLLYFAENNKASLLKERITRSSSDNLLPLSEQGRAAAISERLCYYRSLSQADYNATAQLHDSLRYYEKQFAAFKQHIAQKYPRVYTLKYGQQSLSVRNVQQSLQTGQAFLEYFSDGETYYCLAISKHKIIYKICGNKSGIDSLITAFNQAILEKKNGRTLSRRLYSILIPSLQEKNFILCPAGKLQSLAFDALLADDHPHHYLVFDHTLQYTFSAATYFRHRELSDSKSVFAFCPSFENSPYEKLNTAEEHRALRSFPYFEGVSADSALKYKFLLQCNKAGIIHIASHVVADSAAPLQSALIFQPSEADHTLSINEIRRLNMNTQLITLATCHSNFGQEQAGEGLLNFAWAFHYAGAHNILSTHWTASDRSTASIISDFYKNLREGKSKQEALQLAKIHYLEHTDAIGAQPFYWANYTLYGDESPVDVLPDFLARFWWTPLLFLLLCYIALLMYKTVIAKYSHETV